MAVAVGIAIALLGSAALTAGWSGSLPILLSGLTLLSVAASMAVICIATIREDRLRDRARFNSLGSNLEHRLESLKDIQWELRENEARYRNLLDSQSDIIIRRNADGELIFANQAFDRIFGAEAGRALGQPFHPLVLDEDSRTEPAECQGKTQRYVQQILTADGPRWFAWEDNLVAGESDGAAELQSVGRDVTEQRNAEAALQEAHDQAEAANRAKSRFLAVMSHEIRTPMNGILGMTSLMLDTDLTPEQGTYARAVRQSARTLLSLIDEILDFSKIEAGRLQLQAEAFALDETVQGIVELLAPRAHEKSVEIAWSIDPRLPSQVVGDEVRLRQILINLIGNAIKFTERGGVMIEVAQLPAGQPRQLGAAPAPLAGDVRPGTHAVRFRVRDTGIGLTAAAASVIFSEFEQADTTRSRKFGGTGLGLAISRRLAEAMGGSISVTSTPGEGSCFDAMLELPPVADANSLSDCWTQPESKLTVFIALARTIEADAIARTLRDCGHRILSAAVCDAQDTLTALIAEDSLPDAVIIDTASGVEFAAQLAACADQSREADNAALPEAAASQARLPASGRKPCRFLVAIDATERGELSRYAQAGFPTYLMRPVRPQSLLRQLCLPNQIEAEPEAAKSATATPSSPQPQFPGVRVLLAEDNDINALLARRMLEKVGASVVRVSNGRAAVSAVEQSLDICGSAQFDIVLMDVHMPELDGLAATAEIRTRLAARNADPEGTAGRRSLPIIALTANAFQEDRRRCLAAGMDDYLAKPFEPADLTDLIRKWCDPAQINKASAA